MNFNLEAWQTWAIIFLYLWAFFSIWYLDLKRGGNN